MATVPDRRDRSVTRGRASILAAGAGLAGLAMVLALAPEYLTSRGLPLDEAWVHAVYGRSLARVGTLAFNPGVAGTGETSPLWALSLAVIHATTSRVPAVLLAVKLLGLALHLLTVVVLVGVFTWRGRLGLPALAGCMLAAFHPDVVSASMSGTETALATLAAGVLVLAVGAGSAGWTGLLAFTLPFVRPELTILSFAMPVGLFMRRDRRRLAVLTVTACLGTVVAYGVIGARNLALSGRLLPAAFHAGIGSRTLGLFDSEVIGFSDVLGRLPVVDSSIVLLIAVLMAVYVVGDRQASPTPLPRAAVALLGALLFCAASFILVPPLDPATFEHQRHVLPVLPLMVAAVPILVCGVVGRLLPARAGRGLQIAVVALLVLSELVVSRFRYPTLSHDALDVDKVQVVAARQLASLTPDQVVWAADAGAVRYFGGAFVVDLLGGDGLHALGADGQQFLDTHRPRYIELVPVWGSLDSASSRRLPVTHFAPPPLDRTSNEPPMPERWLVECDDPAVSGHVVVRGRSFNFRCAGGH
jgi:hypothetical protein